MLPKDLADKRARLLKLAQEIPERCRLVEQSPGSSFSRKLLKLRRFGNRYVTWALHRLGLSKEGPVAFPLFFGRRLRLPFRMEDDFVTLFLTGALGGPEYKLTRFLIRNLKPEDVFYDVGASYGFYTFLASEFLPPERVHSFEPLPEIFGLLKSNAAGEAVNNLALWDKSGEGEINMHHLGHEFSTLAPEMVALDPPRAGRKVRVRTATLDEYARAHAAPTMMKIDVEGAEERVIDGGREFFTQNSPVVSLEVIAGEGARLSLKAVDKMIGLGYHAFALTEDGELEGPVPGKDWPARLERLTRENAMDRIAWDNVILQKGSWPVPPKKA
jgi:FkbM family methyltransferase